CAQSTSHGKPAPWPSPLRSAYWQKPTRAPVVDVTARQLLPVGQVALTSVAQRAGAEPPSAGALHVVSQSFVQTDATPEVGGAQICPPPQDAPLNGSDW